MRVYLKIKIKSLAYEAADIHREERLHNPGARGRIKARRTLARANDLSDSQRRRLERRLEKPSSRSMAAFWGLRQHRQEVVRPEARAALIAYGFMKGLPYSSIEKPTLRNPPNWKRVEELIKKYGDGGLDGRMALFAAWREAA